jgi:hypothetical protein
MNTTAVGHALGALRRYFVDAADRTAWDHQHTVELNDVIRSCVETLAAHRRGSQAAARLPLEAIRHAMGYFEELLDIVSLD